MNRYTVQSLVALLASGLVAAGCGSGGAAPDAQQVAVQVAPPEAQVRPGGSVSFAASVSGTADTSVVWTVAEAGAGSVDSTGRYTAPGSTGVFHVVATSRADPSVSSAAVVTVTPSPPAVSITVAPATASVAVGGTLQFSAAVTGTATTAVAWTVLEGTAGGSVDATGRYTAPSTPGTYHVLATSQADTTRQATATVVVTSAVSTAAKMPIVSRDPSARLYSSTGTPSPTAYWRSSGYPAWYAWDLTSVAGPKSHLLLGWYNTSSDYDQSVRGQAYNLPSDFVIEAHKQAGGSPPASGWTTLASVTGNTVKSRTFVLDATSYNWIRFRATAEFPGNQLWNHDFAGYLDLYDITQSGNSDSWAFLGDSIISLELDHDDSSTNFGALIFSATGQMPAFENCGIGYDRVTDGAPRLTTLLANSAARFVPIAYGMNDAANGYPSDQSFSTALRALAQRVIDAGRIPVIPTVPATNDPTHNAGLGDPLDASRPNSINRQIYVLRNAMRAEGKPVIDGPDLWTYFINHLSEMGAGTDVHPRGAGATSYLVQWANAMKAQVYGVP